MKKELLLYIDSIYREPYRLFGNNCINKSLKIKAKAEALEERVDLILCLVVTRLMWRGHLFPVFINPHVYNIIDNEKVDVAIDPALEERLGKNDEQVILIPLNLSWIGRGFSSVAKRLTIKRAKAGISAGEVSHGS